MPRAEANSEKCEAEHSAPKSRKGRRRWPKRLNAHRKTFIPAQWQALMQVEADFAETQTALAAVRAAVMGDLQTMIAAAELLRIGLPAVAIQLSGRPLSRAGGHTIPKSRSFRHLGVSNSKSRRRGFGPAVNEKAPLRRP